MALKHLARRGHAHILVQNVQDASYTLIKEDAGKVITKAFGGGGVVYTIPTSVGGTTISFDTDAFDIAAFFGDAFNFSTAEGAGGVKFEIGTMIAIDNSGGSDLSIAITDDTLIWTANNSAGTRTLADGGLAVILKVAATTWKITGEALT